MSELRKLGFVVGAAVCAGFWSTAAAGAEFQQRTASTVIELFTSQGCSSCPPADALLGKLADRDGVIALTMPVDYWDYLGWKDTLASPANSARQRHYASTRGDGQVYTPQVVVNGVKHAVGSYANDIDAAILEATAATQPWQAAFTVKYEKDVLQIQIPAMTNGARGTVWLADYRHAASVAIERGENSGREITYTNVVRKLTPIGEWDGSAMSLSVKLADVTTKGSDGCVIFLQKGDGGPILGAVELRG